MRWQRAVEQSARCIAHHAVRNPRSFFQSLLPQHSTQTLANVVQAITVCMSACIHVLEWCWWWWACMHVSQSGSVLVCRYLSSRECECLQIYRQTQAPQTNGLTPILCHDRRKTSLENLFRFLVLISYSLSSQNYRIIVHVLQYKLCVIQNEIMVAEKAFNLPL